MSMFSRFAGLFRSRRLDRELDAEIRSHLEMRVAQNLAEGMTPEDARLDALRRFGNASWMKEETRRADLLPWLETVAQDARYAARNLRRNPVLTGVVILSLALGIGANAAIFSVIDAVMLRLLPVRAPGELQVLTYAYPKWPETVIDDIEGGVEQSDGFNVGHPVSSVMYESLRDRNRVFSSTIALASNFSLVNLGFNGRAYSAQAEGVSGNFFQGLGVPAAAGRTLLPTDDSEAAPAAVVLSHAFWRKEFGGDASVIGRSIVINATPMTVVGVAPSYFTGVRPDVRADLWLPLAIYAAQSRRISDDNLVQPKVWWLTVLGRVKAGVTREQADAEARVLFQQVLVAQAPDAAADPNLPHAWLTPASRGLSSLRGELTKPLLLLMTMVGVVLLIACGNVAGLLLAKATTRQREMAVRLSLGARPARLIRQLLTESVMLALLGGLAGLMVARWASEALTALLASGGDPVPQPAHTDPRILVFTAAISVVSGILFGLAPALHSARVDIFAMLKQAASAALAGHRSRVGRSLVGGQVALALVLIVSATLLVRTLLHLQSANLGFERQSLITFGVQPGLNGYKGAALARYYEELQRRIETIPGVRAAGFSMNAAIGSGWSQGRANIPGYTEPGKPVRVYRHYIGSGYFAALGIPLNGREVTAADVPGAPPIVIVNRAVARAYMHGDNPVGHTLDMGSPKRPNGGTIVGVAGDVKYGDIRKDPPPTAYFSYRQAPFDPVQMTYVVRATGDPAALGSAIQSQAAALDSTVPVRDLLTENEVVDKALYLERTFALLSSSFGTLALLLACVGLYGTMAYTVSRRTSEIGIRMALGADPRDIVAMVLREALIVVVAGAAVGLPLAWLGSRLLSARLFGLSPHDPATLLGSLACLFGVGLLAGFAPARRASRVDPMVALRCE